MQILHVVKCYNAEVKWRDERYIPADVDEHLEISMGSIAGMQTLVLTFVSLGNVTTREAIDWALTCPKIVKGVSVIARVMNDIMSHEVCIHYTPIFSAHDLVNIFVTIFVPCMICF